MTKKDYNPSKAHQDAMKKNPIEEAIGDRATPKEKTHPNIPREQILQAEQIPDEPSPSEMLTLEELNRRTEARLQDQYPEENLTPEEQRVLTNQRVPTIPVSKPDPQPVTKTSSPESPPQKINDFKKGLVFDSGSKEDTPDDNHLGLVISSVDEKEKTITLQSVEDIELTALRKYILEDGFVLATVAFHIVTLCAEPMTTPSTTTWDFVDRANIPDMVLALLYQPGYIEGIWPSLKIVMGSNKGNAAWTAGIATTIAFFDCIRTLPALKELQNER